MVNRQLSLWLLAPEPFHWWLPFVSEAEALVHRRKKDPDQGHQCCWPLCPRISGFWSRATWLVAGSEELDVGLERLILVHERALGAFLWIKKIERRSWSYRRENKWLVGQDEGNRRGQDGIKSPSRGMCLEKELFETAGKKKRIVR